VGAIIAKVEETLKVMENLLSLFLYYGIYK